MPPCGNTVVACLRGGGYGIIVKKHGDRGYARPSTRCQLLRLHPNTFQSQGLPEVSSLTIRLQPTQPLFMHVNPNRISILASRQLAQVELHRVERLMDA